MHEREEKMEKDFFAYIMESNENEYGINIRSVIPSLDPKTSILFRSPLSPCLPFF